MPYLPTQSFAELHEQLPKLVLPRPLTGIAQSQVVDVKFIFQLVSCIITFVAMTWVVCMLHLSQERLVQLLGGPS